MTQTRTHRPPAPNKNTVQKKASQDILNASYSHCAELDLLGINWETLIQTSSISTFPAQTELFRQGNRVKYVFILERGMIKVTHTDDRGNHRIVALVSTPGYILGAACAVLETHFVSYVTLTPSKLRPIPSELFRQALQTDVLMSWKLHQVHCRTIYDQVNGSVRQVRQSVRQRLEEFIWQIASAMGTHIPQKNARVKLPLKYSEMAQLFMVSPEHLSRVVKKMIHEHIIEREKGMIVVPDPDKLWRE